MGKLISVIIPTFNRQLLTDRAVESAVTNYQSSVEIIVIDDCGSEPYRYAKQVNNAGVAVRVIRTETNSGPGGARKRGVAEASGELIAFMDSDDQFGREWLDTLMGEYQKNRTSVAQGIMIVGLVQDSKKAQQLVGSFLRKLPDGFRLCAARIVTVMFNPFYIQSLAVSKNLCFFKDGLRYCEDYCMTSVALFKATRLISSGTVGCILGRHPSEPGGLSDARLKMFEGEFSTRVELLKSASVNILYKVLIPFGMVFQLLRSALKLHLCL